MAESNSAWGDLAAYDDEAAATWDAYASLPEAGENAVLDEFCERKRITLGSLVRLGARLSDDTVICFAFPGGLKYRDLVTDRRWNYVGSEFHKLKLVLSGPTPGSRVIVCEGETDGARLTLLYPDADVAILPAGARRFTTAFAEQLIPYDQVLVGLDNDDAGVDGTALVAEHVPQAERFPPPGSVKDWCEVDEAPPLPAPVELVRAGGIVFDDLRQLLSGELPDPEVLVEDLLYAEGVHWISAHPGAGKTTLAMHIALLVMADGRHVVWLDYEGGVRKTVRRLLESGADVPTLLECFHYAGWPTKAEDHIEACAERWPGCLVVIDSCSKALRSSGIDENSPSEVTDWCMKIVRSVNERELPLIVIDHIEKTAKNTRYARGAGSKLADTDYHMYVETLSEFRRDTVGHICVHNEKDREGCMPAKSYYSVGDGAGNLPIYPEDPPDPEDPNAPGI